MDPARQIIQVNEYELRDSADAYVAAITALAGRTESQGHPGVLSYRFYVNRSENTAGATIVYADADAFVAHHRLAYQWDEMATLAGMDVIVVSASGNDFYPLSSVPGVAYPAADANSLSVGAVFDADIGGVAYTSGAEAFTTAPDRVTPSTEGLKNR